MRRYERWCWGLCLHDTRAVSHTLAPTSLPRLLLTQGKNLNDLGRRCKLHLHWTQPDRQRSRSGAHSGAIAAFVISCTFLRERTERCAAVKTAMSTVPSQGPYELKAVVFNKGSVIGLGMDGV